MSRSTVEGANSGMQEPVENQNGNRIFIRLITSIRSVLGSCFAVPFTVVCCITVITCGFMGLDSFNTRVIKVWAHTLLFVYGIKVEAKGEEKLPLAGGGILVFNHQSLFDIPVVISTTFKHIRFGAKIELFKVPFFGAAMRAAGTLPIARQNRNEVMRVYKEAEARFMRNTIFVLAPEGTRQKEPVLGRFKKGPFFFALSGGVPLIPVVIRGAHSVLPKQSLMVNVGRWTRKIHVEYLDPVITQGLGTAGVSELMNQVRDAMSDVYDRMPTGN